MPLPNTQPKLGFPYDTAPEANSAFINDNTDASQIDDKVRVFMSETAKGFEETKKNIDYLQDRETTVTRQATNEINVYFDGPVQKGDIVFPVDTQIVGDQTLITVRKTPLAENHTLDAIGMATASHSPGDTGPIITRGILEGLFWPRDLEPPTRFQQVLIGYDPRTGWNLLDPVSYDTDIIEQGQKLIGHYFAYDDGPPAVVSMFLTGFQQSNLFSTPNIVHVRNERPKTLDRIIFNAGNKDTARDVMSASITPLRSRAVKVTLNAFLHFRQPNAVTVVNSPAEVMYNIQRGSTYLYPAWVRNNTRFKTAQDVRDRAATNVRQAYLDWYPWQLEWIDTEATLGEENTYRIHYRNASYDTVVGTGSFIRLEEVVL